MWQIWLSVSGDKIFRGKLTNLGFPVREIDPLKHYCVVTSLASTDSAAHLFKRRPCKQGCFSQKAAAACFFKTHWMSTGVACMVDPRWPTNSSFCQIGARSPLIAWKQKEKLFWRNIGTPGPGQLIGLIIWWTLCVHDGTERNDAKNVVHTHHFIRMDQDSITLVIGYTRRGQFYDIFVGFRS